ncbi:hypothetical protein ACWCPL_41705, partial [Streptomyces sp. NPDC001948]
GFRHAVLSNSSIHNQDRKPSRPFGPLDRAASVRCARPTAGYLHRLLQAGIAVDLMTTAVLGPKNAGSR